MISQKINRHAKQISAEIISNKKLGPYHHMVFAVGDIAAHVKPGNFVAISVGGESSSMVYEEHLQSIEQLIKACWVEQ
jgi:dihydroorotate dehydrogenase electron transfer subunit